ncbi:hypothetical protein AKJ40_04830 [candidate division MSBL1 archaeon SCGC-AAA259M10]|uniref:Transposase n=1 Tax=candidate division MSBL1 archaeon SCGC-AAA259M10 TaxID=1698270 RepID=A0A133UVU6_9EURY|nr:hypothetical protein AKJ40_04830 [candidate division MSBL1 archaeon SCGC-AAA259M10]
MKLDLEVEVEGEDLTLTGMIDQIQGLEKECLKELIYAEEENLLKKVCGERHEETRYQRYGRKDPRKIKTSIGELELEPAKVRDKETGEVFSPIEEELEIPEGKNVNKDLSLESIEQVSEQSYRKAVETVKRLSNSDLSKSTLWRRVQEIDLATEPKGDVDVLLVDDTKVHSQEKEGFHFPNLVLGYNTEEDEYSLLFMGVDEDWTDIREEIGEEVDLSEVYVVSDSDREILDAFRGAKGIQLCHFHVAKYANYCLWKEDAPKNFRKKMRRILKSRLSTLQNSVKKFWRDEDTERLKNRISWFREELDRWAERAEERGFESAADYVRRNGEKFVTFAKAALEGEYVPHTNNKEEREMRELAYRAKKIGGSWSKDGLRNVSLCQTISRLDKSLFGKFKEVYLGEAGTLNYSVSPTGG